MLLMVMKIMIFVVLMIASVKDFRTKKIPLFLIVLCGLLSLTSGIITINAGGTLASIAETLIPGIFLLIISIITKEGIGFGDGLMVMALGPILGLEITVLGLVISLMLTNLVSIGLLVSKKGTRKTCLPFIPFLTIGMGVASFA